MTRYNFSQYDLTASLQRFLRENTGFRTDLIEDGYEYPSERPLITIEQMIGEFEYRIKSREAVDATYRWQVGLHAGYYSERLKEQERISNLFLFKKIPYFNFTKSTEEPVGFFDVKISAIMPMLSDDIAKQSRRHAVYFDVELNTYKRSC